MSAGSAKVSLILELKERIKAGLGRAKSYVNQNVKDMKDKLNSLKMSTIDTFKGMASGIPGLEGMLGAIANPYVLATTAVLALGAAYVKTVNEAEMWNKSMAKVNVTAQLTKEELGQLSSQVMEIGARNSTPLQEVPDAFNKIISAGLDVKTSLNTLEPVLKASKAGFSDLATTAAATVSTMNSSGIMDANRVLDILFATLNKGNAEFNDIAQYLPKIIPMAKNAGMSLEETAGAFAYLTAQGMQAEASATGLMNVFKSLSDTRTLFGSKTTKGFEGIGVQVFDAQGKVRNLIDIIGDLRTKMSGLTDKQRIIKFDSIGLDMEASTALSSMVGNYEKLKETIDFTTNSQGQLNEAVKNAETPMDVWKVVSNQVKMAMISIGQTGLPIIKTVGEYVLNTIQYFRDLYANSTIFRDSLSAIGYVAQFSFKMMTAPIRLVFNMLETLGNIAGWVGEKLFGTGFSFEQAYQKIRPYLMWIMDILVKISSIAYKLATWNFKAAFAEIKNFKLPNLDEMRKRSAEEIKNAKEGTKGKINPFATAVAPGESDGKKGAGKAAADSVNKITDGAKQVRNITVNIDAFNKGGINTENTTLKGMSAEDIEKWMNDMFMRMIANMDRSYS